MGHGTCFGHVLGSCVALWLQVLFFFCSYMCRPPCNALRDRLPPTSFTPRADAIFCLIVMRFQFVKDTNQKPNQNADNSHTTARTTYNKTDEHTNSFSTPLPGSDNGFPALHTLGSALSSLMATPIVSRLGSFIGVPDTALRLGCLPSLA